MFPDQREEHLQRHCRPGVHDKTLIEKAIQDYLQTGSELGDDEPVEVEGVDYMFAFGRRIYPSDEGISLSLYNIPNTHVHTLPCARVIRFHFIILSPLPFIHVHI